MIARMNMFNYGEVGERLGGVRESDIYSQSAQKIENLVINEMGNLKIAKGFNTFSNITINENDNIIDTKFNYFVGSSFIDGTYQATIYNRTNNFINSKIVHNYKHKNLRITKSCDDKLFLIGDDVGVYQNKDNNLGRITNYLDEIKLPIKNKEIITLELFKVIKFEYEETHFVEEKETETEKISDKEEKEKEKEKEKLPMKIHVVGWNETGYYNFDAWFVKKGKDNNGTYNLLFLKYDNKTDDQRFTKMGYYKFYMRAINGGTDTDLDMRKGSQDTKDGVLNIQMNFDPNKDRFYIERAKGKFNVYNVVKVDVKINIDTEIKKRLDTLTLGSKLMNIASDWSDKQSGKKIISWRYDHPIPFWYGENKKDAKGWYWEMFFDNTLHKVYFGNFGSVDNTINLANLHSGNTVDGVLTLTKKFMGNYRYQNYKYIEDLKEKDNGAYIYPRHKEVIVDIEEDTTEKKKEDKKLDIKIPKYKEVIEKKIEWRVTPIARHETPNLRVKDGKIYLNGSDTQIVRVYKDYKGVIGEEQLEESMRKDGLMFGVFRKYEEPKDKKYYYIGNSRVSFGKFIKDKKYDGEYFDTITPNCDGELTYGEQIKFINDITTVGLYHDRLLIVSNGEFFFSKKGDYTDFRTDTKNDSAFYFKPTPINNIYPKIYDVAIGDKIYVPTSQGVYLISPTSNSFTYNSYGVFIASEIPAHSNTAYTHKHAHLLLNGVYYYLTENKEIRAIEKMTDKAIAEAYTVSIVEKFEIKPYFDKLFKIKYNNKVYLGATRTNEKILYMYEQIDYKMYRRYRLTVPYKIRNVIRDVLFGEKAFKCNEDNTERALLRINPPYMKSKQGLSYASDFSSRVQRVFIKVLNEDKGAIKGVKINDTLITKSAMEDDMFSVFKIETSFPVLNGFDIEFITNENNKVFEILGIDLDIQVVGD